MRKLAHIERIVSLEPITGADRIEKATVLGWECVVKKGDFKVGDLCIYIEVDSIVPDTPYFEFMKERKFRVRTIKLRKQISQGLVLPVDILETHIQDFNEGDDITEILQIKKHDPQAEAEAKEVKKRTEKYPSYIRWLLQYSFFRRMFYRFGVKTKNFPVWLKKTDEERIQNIPNVFKQWNGQLCYYSEKLEGQNSNYAIYKPKKFIDRLFAGEFYVCSREVHKVTESNNNWWQVARKYDIENKLRKYGDNIAIQGEIVGPGIQGNIYDFDELKYFVYNVWDIDKQRYFNFHEKMDFCNLFGFETVPILGEFIMTEDMTVKSMLDKAHGKTVISENSCLREGIVIRQIKDDSKSFKAVDPIYLLKGGE